MTEKLRVIPLGGLGEIGRNMMLLEYGDDIIVVDVGLMFPEEEMLGVDLVIPDFSYLRDHKDKLRAVFLTHGHEDHVGALPYFRREFNAPIYSAKLTDGLIRVKLQEHRLLQDSETHVITPGEVITAGIFEVEFFTVAHSIPDACGLIIRTPLGLLVHTGDFKLDHTPVMDQHTDLIRLAQVGAEGCLLLMADSTYAEQEGYTPSEQLVGEALRTILVNAQGRVIVATFASLISRVQLLVDAAVFTGRKIFVTGRSMIDNVAMARQLGYINAPEGVIIGVEEMRNTPASKLVVITTGSQGEPTSALTRMANGDHRHITISKGDTIVLSSSPVPGNETAVYRNVDNLFRLGADVLYNRISNIHVRGHASREELKIIQGLLQPEYFVPIHGEYRHLVVHARLAESVGVPQGNAFVLTDGDVLEIDEESAWIGDRVPASYVYVDGLGIGDVDQHILRDRAHLSTDGVVVVMVAVDKQTGKLERPAEVLARGFVDVEDREDLLDQTRRVAAKALEGVEHYAEFGDINSRIRDAVSKFLYDETRRRPMVLTVTVEV
ncbi:MAG: ribonuclease J [Dehalococcoidia bacterium]|uniref:ribonuclease J n=1 Tax=Candidatus Amarobacter glycogenicus TaxID=3140699 RepID=UPI002A157F81|nr:ribonuclease J [Dehalococcoidia bacterium]MBK6560259.1 ribonuclease J [Dehalococcoidia bacterium]MBK7328492.1 ribonuclease J [Dehalococcoidia bacterium]MBK8559433.1 ribonuclease J [Dehalococcoidia bacterium]MBK9342494.1 ribonuclease J [Dehalococcoidia bacterium]